MAKGKGASIYLALPTWSVAQSNQVSEGAKVWNRSNPINEPKWEDRINISPFRDP